MDAHRGRDGCRPHGRADDRPAQWVRRQQPRLEHQQAALDRRQPRADRPGAHAHLHGPRTSRTFAPPFRPPHTLVGGVQYTVKERADWINDDTGIANCTSSDTQGSYIEITSTVTWKGMGITRPVAAQSYVTPPVGSFGPGQGSIGIKLTDRDGSPVSSTPCPLGSSFNDHHRRQRLRRVRLHPVRQLRRAGHPEPAGSTSAATSRPSRTAARPMARRRSARSSWTSRRRPTVKFWTYPYRQTARAATSVQQVSFSQPKMIAPPPEAPLGGVRVFPATASGARSATISTGDDAVPVPRWLRHLRRWLPDRRPDVLEGQPGSDVAPDDDDRQRRPRRARPTWRTSTSRRSTSWSRSGRSSAVPNATVYDHADEPGVRHQDRHRDDRRWQQSRRPRRSGATRSAAACEHAGFPYGTYNICASSATLQGRQGARTSRTRTRTAPTSPSSLTSQRVVPMIRDESGQTLVELMIATVIGLIVVFAAFLMLENSLRQNTNISHARGGAPRRAASRWS